jgi:hypothetical protein
MQGDSLMQARSEAKPWHREHLDDLGAAVQHAIKDKYDILWHAPNNGLLDDGYLGFKAGHQHAPIFVRVQRWDESDPGWNMQREELMRSKASMIEAQHPAIVAPRDFFDVPEQKATAFVFDAPDRDAVTLRQFLRGIRQDPDEKVIGALFTPIVAGLQFLEQKSLLPNFARVDIDSCYVYPDGTIRMLHPAVTVHGEKGHHHAHKKLEKRLKKVEKKAKKGDQEAVEEREDLFERFIIADLSILLYEIMTRKLSHSSRHKMVNDAKKMHKKEQFSPELSQLLVDMLQAGRTPKKDLISIDQIMQRPLIQGFMNMLINEVAHCQRMSEFQKAVYQRGFRQQQMFGGSIAARGKWLASGENRESLKRRRQMVRGEGQQLSVLRDQPVEKRNGVRFDIPLEGEARFIPEGRRLSMPFIQQQQAQQSIAQQPIGQFQQPIDLQSQPIGQQQQQQQQQQFARPVGQFQQSEQPIVQQSQQQPIGKNIDRPREIGQIGGHEVRG